MARFQLANVFRLPDPVLEHIAAIFSLELNRSPHPAQGLLIESLARRWMSWPRFWRPPPTAAARAVLLAGEDGVATIIRLMVLD